MTPQIPDFFMYKGDMYNVVGINGKGLLIPQSFDMSPGNFSSGCSRGYYIEYTCIKENLALTALSVCLSKKDEYKELGGISPVGDTEHFHHPSDKEYSLYKYRNLEIFIPYSGGFLIAKDFIKEVNVEMYPQSYETVFELLFLNGKLIKVIDWSESVARERKEILDNIPNYFKVEFSLKYDSLYFYHMKQYAQ
jgi:hypothetical protein